MLANYGYKDGSGEYFITIDTEKCNGCGVCVKACPAEVFAVAGEDPYDPMREEPVAVVVQEKKNKLKEACALCKPSVNRPPLRCVQVCKAGALSHSW